MIKQFLSALALSAAAASALAQAWPAQPIKYIVPFPPGGATDLISRPVADALQARLGQSVVVENIGGAGGTIGVARLKQSAANGYTIGLGNSATQTIAPHLLAKPPYDALKDFTAVTMLTEYANVLVVSPQLPARDLKEFFALARSKEGGLTYASSGNGSSNHLTAALLAQVANLRFVHVPYKGNGAAIADVMAGHADWMFATISEVQSHVQAGKLRALGISTKARDSLMPEVAPIADALPGFEVVGFMGLFAPKDLPAPILTRLSTEVNAILRDPALVKRFEAQGMRARPSTPEELAARVTKDFALWKSTMDTAGIKAE